MTGEPDAIDFDGQVALVTGAGRGLGRAHALLLAARGARVLVNDAGRARDGDREPSPADAVVAEIRAAGGTALASHHDVTDPAAVDAMVALAREELGGLHAVVSNAGFLRDRTLVKQEVADLRAVLDVHLLGGLLVARAALPAMLEQGYGRIVFTTSGAGLYGNVGQASYGAAKAGLVGLTKVLALETARRDVRVNAVAPGARTRMLDGIDLGRVGEHLDPGQVAPLVAFLCSRRCPVSGEVYECAGGQHRRVVTGASGGWFAGVDAVPTLEQIAERFDEINDLSTLTHPRSAPEANRSLFADLLAATKAPRA